VSACAVAPAPRQRSSRAFRAAGPAGRFPYEKKRNPAET
jgi:hypothetical protein